MKLSEQLEYEDLTLEQRLYEVEAARTEEYREIHKQAIAEWIAQLEAELEMYERDETFGTLAIQLVKLEAENEALRELFWMTLYYWMGPEFGPMPTDEEMYNKIAGTHALLTGEDDG